MRVRAYAESDLETFKRTHFASGLNYKFPELDSPLFIVKTVVERAGNPTTLLTGRIEAETYLLTSGSPRERWEDIQAAQEAYLSELWSQGIDSTYCCVPKEVNHHFAKRMRFLGWEEARKGWVFWTRGTM